jgi:nucleotide-binding universal stress UspA family protein
MSSKRILVALSPSNDRDVAFERGLALAKAGGAELYLLHAVPASQRDSSRAAERRRRSAELRERAEAEGVSALAVEQHGDPADIIVLHADAWFVDLIVIGIERRTGWARWRERPVAERVLRRTTRPTLVVRSDDAGDAPAFGHVAVAVDLSSGSARLIDTARQLSGGELTVIHAVDGVGSAGDGWMVPEYRGDVLMAARRRMADLLPPDSGVAVNLHVADGLPADALRASVAAIRPGLVVVGRSPRFLQPAATAVRVLRDSDRAVLMVPDEASAVSLDLAAPVRRRAA